MCEHFYINEKLNILNESIQTYYYNNHLVILDNTVLCICMYLYVDVLRYIILINERKTKSIKQRKSILFNYNN